MKRRALIRHLKKHGCELIREGRKHSVWSNVALNLSAAVPRHTEIANRLVKDSYKELGIPILIVIRPVADEKFVFY